MDVIPTDQQDDSQIGSTNASKEVLTVWVAWSHVNVVFRKYLQGVRSSSVTRTVWRFWPACYIPGLQQSCNLPRIVSGISVTYSLPLVGEYDFPAACGGRDNWRVWTALISLGTSGWGHFRIPWEGYLHVAGCSCTESSTGSCKNPVHSPRYNEIQQESIVNLGQNCSL
jgi:hypothetical protein